MGPVWNIIAFLMSVANCLLARKARCRRGVNTGALYTISYLGHTAPPKKIVLIPIYIAPCQKPMIRHDRGIITRAPPSARYRPLPTCWPWPNPSPYGHWRPYTGDRVWSLSWFLLRRPCLYPIWSHCYKNQDGEPTVRLGEDPPKPSRYG